MFLLILFVATINTIIQPQTYQASVSGRVISSENQLPLINANIIIKSSPQMDRSFSTGTITDSLGNFKMKLPYGSYMLTVSYIGYEKFEKIFALTESNNSFEISIQLKPSVINEEEITITGERKEPSTIKQEIEPKDLKRMPTIYNDVLRAVQILPGVSSGSELSSGYNVRGGNFDDNLIYLNGFEIYRPFLLRQGIEENKTLINPDLVEEFRFYNGSFPASYGDKMSSALEVNYKLKDTDTLSGYAKVDMLNAGLTIKKKFGKINLAAAVRYAYPGLFLNELQTNGDYKPSYQDVQIFADIPVNADNRFEVLVLYADNKFNLTPSDWIGHFGGFSRGDIRALDILYFGERNYSFTTSLAGIKYSSLLSKNLQLNLSAARYNTKEDESSDLFSEFFYRSDAENETNREFIKSARENVDNKLDLVTYEFIPEIKFKKNNHLFTAGVNIRLTDLENQIDEAFSESSDTVSTDLPVDRFISESYKLNSYSVFVQDDFNLFENVFINAGIRGTYFDLNSEFFFSPRTTILYIPSAKHNFTFSWGYYYQPPYYNELRNKSGEDAKKLKAQRSIHYSAGWEYLFKEKVKMNLEFYYKDLDNLIPYYIDREKTEYLDQNSNEGFAYGFDIMFQGEIVEDMNSWIGYGYLNTKERNKTSNEPYRRRLTDQTHTLQIFLQDKIKKHPNWQAHTRLLFGSGHLYNLRQTITDPVSGKKYLQITPDKVDEFFIYFRIDMGLSAGFDIGEHQKLVVIAEVLNIFDHNNYGGYRFVQVAAEDPAGNNVPRIFAVPKVLSERFFNVSLELRF
ncbi:MAG: TonB-dependent receptor [Ignavibacteriales bacterium]|nr:MAG: TonB-dependent receptor [Ignavibacteriales bacterium]